MNTEELEIAINSAPVTISWISSDLVYLGVNPLLARLMGRSEDEIVGSPLGSYTDQPFIQEFAQELFESSNDELSREIYTILDEQEHWYHILGRKYEKNTKATLIGIDITEQKESQRKSNLMEKLALIGEMASGLIHEINNPLTTINLKTQKLKRLKFDSAKDFQEKVSEIANQMIETEDRVANIIKTMKEFAHINPSTVDSKQACDIAALIQQGIDVCEGKLKKQDISISYNIEKDLTVPLYETEVLQIVVNLITNAVDATAGLDQKWVKISATSKSDSCYISVTDSGNGIPKHLQQKILQPFFTTKEKGKGTGIGLGLCQKFAHHHEGCFYIDNTSSNTKFVLKLPLGK